MGQTRQVEIHQNGAVGVWDSSGIVRFLFVRHPDGSILYTKNRPFDEVRSPEFLTIQRQGRAIMRQLAQRNKR